MSNKNSINEQIFQEEIEARFLATLRHHLAGWRSKVEEDFSQVGFEKELANLRSDPVYPKFALDSPQYVLVRLMGRMSISIGRRLGDIYDKIPRFVAAARFDLSPDEVAPRLEGLELDIGIPKAKLSAQDATHLESVVEAHLDNLWNYTGLGIEMRYNFNPNDSARLRKDVRMAGLVESAGFLPIYLIFSSISPRAEAIARLSRAGWNFLIGNDAGAFIRELLGVDLAATLDRPRIRTEVQKEVTSLLQAIFNSYAFKQAAMNLS